MGTVRDKFDEHPTAITAILMLGLGMTFDILGVELLSDLFIVVGLIVVVPLVFLLYDPDDETDTAPKDAPTPDDPVEELRHRYATGELTEAEFERKLDRLLETEDLEVDAADRREPDLERELE